MVPGNEHSCCQLRGSVAGLSCSCPSSQAGSTQCFLRNHPWTERAALQSQLSLPSPGRAAAEPRADSSVLQLLPSELSQWFELLQRFWVGFVSEHSAQPSVFASCKILLLHHNSLSDSLLGRCLAAPHLGCSSGCQASRALE